MTPATSHDTDHAARERPVACITGASRRVNIGSAVARKFAVTGWDVALTYWRPYDTRMPWGSTPAEIDELVSELQSLGASVAAIEADLENPEAAAQVISETVEQLGPVRALILSHCESVDSAIHDTTVESFDRHFAVNARASWLLIKAFAEQFAEPQGSGRIVALTSDHCAFNLPYGASKGALDRIVIAAAAELASQGITANVVNPGATDTGWMTDQQLIDVAASTFGARVGVPTDVANLVAFLCSHDGGWVNGQLLYSNGGRTST